MLLVGAADATRPWRAAIHDGPAPADPTTLLTPPDWPLDRTLVFAVLRTAAGADYPLAQLHPVTTIEGTCRLTADVVARPSVGPTADNVAIEGAIHRLHPDLMRSTDVPRLSFEVTLNTPFPAVADRREPPAPGDPTGVAVVRVSRQGFAARHNLRVAASDLIDPPADQYVTALRRGATDRLAEVDFDQPALGDIFLLQGLPSPYRLKVHLPDGTTYDTTEEQGVTVIVQQAAHGAPTPTRVTTEMLEAWGSQGRVTPEFVTFVTALHTQVIAAGSTLAVTVQAGDMTDGTTAASTIGTLSPAEAASALVRALASPAAEEIDRMLADLAVAPVSIGAMTARPFSTTRNVAVLLGRLTRQPSSTTAATTAQDALEPLRSPIRLAWLRQCPSDAAGDKILGRLHDLVTDDDDRPTAHPIALPSLHTWHDTHATTLATLDAEFDAAKTFLLALPPYARPVAALPRTAESGAPADVRRSAIMAHADRIATCGSSTARRTGVQPPLVTVPAVLDWFHDACTRAGKLSDWRQRQLGEKNWPTLTLHVRRTGKPGELNRRSLADSIWAELVHDAYRTTTADPERLIGYERYWRAYALMAPCGTDDTDRLTAVVDALAAHLRTEFEGLLAIWADTDARLATHWLGALPKGPPRAADRLGLLARGRAMSIVHRETMLWAGEVLARVPAENNRNTLDLDYERRLSWVGAAQSRPVDDLNGADGLAHVLAEIARIDAGNDRGAGGAPV
jgi:hypothetical protein